MSGPAGGRADAAVRAGGPAIQGRGTSEDTWLPFLAGLALPELPLDDLPERCTVLSPHPDDEVLAVGGLLALLARAGVQVTLVAVTDGEASNPGGTLPPAELAARRWQETADALAELGVEADVHHLHLPDGGAADLEQPVRDRLADPAGWLLAPFEHDGHPDHNAVGRAARTVPGALHYLVWAWHWAAPADPRVPWHRALRVPLPPDVQAAKERALGCFRTQVSAAGPLPEDAPVLPAHVLARFRRPYEIVFR